MNIDEFALLLPKIELHSHVTGAVPDRVLRKLIKLKYPNEDHEKLFLTCKYGTQESRNLISGFRMFDVLHEISNSLSSVEEIIEGILEDYFNENCVLLELRTGPRTLEDGDKETYIRKILDTMKIYCGKKNGQFFCGLNLSINRSKSLETAQQTLDLFEKLLPEYPDHLLGFDYSGNYRDKDFTFFKDVFDQMKRKKYRLTAHFAEVKNDVDSNAILEYKPNRLGHGLFMTDPMIDIMLRESIPMEICLSSNCLSGKVRKVEDHPVYHFYMRYGYPFSMNTDDRGIFSCNLSGEYVKIAKAFQMTPRALFKVSLRAIRHSFLSEEVKKKVDLIFRKFEEGLLKDVTHLVIPPPIELLRFTEHKKNLKKEEGTSWKISTGISKNGDAVDSDISSFEKSMTQAENNSPIVTKEEEEQEDEIDEEDDEGLVSRDLGVLNDYRKLQQQKWEKQKFGEQIQLQQEISHITTTKKKKKNPPKPPFSQPLSSFISKEDEDVLKNKKPPIPDTPTPVRIKRDEDFARKLSAQFEREENDREMALRLGGGGRRTNQNDIIASTTTVRNPRNPPPPYVSDLELARRLQEEQNRQFQHDHLLAQRLQQQEPQTQEKEEVIGESYEELMQLGERLGSVKSKAASPVAVMTNSLEFVIKDPHKDCPKDCENCMVCYEEWEVGETARRLLCMHCFHKKCIDRWLVNYNAICPICREPIIN